MSDISVLLRRWRAGDERAAEAIYNQYCETAFRLAFSPDTREGTPARAAQPGRAGSRTIVTASADFSAPRPSSIRLLPHALRKPGQEVAWGADGEG